MRRVFLLVCLLCAIYCGGCTTPDNITRLSGQEVPPATWVDQAASISSASNSQSLPTVMPETLGLDQVIHLCLLADPKLRAGVASISVAQSDIITSELVPNPKLSILQSLLPLTRDFTPTRQGGPPQFDVYVGYPIDWFIFGKRAAARVVAGLGNQAAELEYQDLARRRVSEAIFAYYDVVEAKAKRELLLQEISDFTKLRIPENAVKDREAITRLRREQNKNLREAETAYGNALVKLRARLGSYGQGRLEITSSLEVSTPESVPPLAQAVQFAEEHRPDLQALNRRTAQAEAQMTVEERKAYPEVVPQVVYTRQFQEKVIGFPDASSWGIGVDFPLPLFDRNQGNRARSQALSSQSQWEREAARAELRSEVEQAVNDFQLATANIKASAAEEIQQVKVEWESACKAYQDNKGSLTVLLDSYKDSHEASLSSLQVRLAYWRALWKLRTALGLHQLQ